MLLVYTSISWLAGILLGRALNLPLWVPLLALLPLISILFFRGQRKIITIACVCLFALLGGVVRYDTAELLNAQQTVQNYVDSGIVEIRGTVAAAPDVRDTYTQITLDVTGIKSTDDWQAADGKVLVFIPRYPTYVYGDVLQITGSLTAPQKIDDFDYPGYLADRGIFSTMAFPEVESFSHHRGFSPLGWIYSLRETLSQKIAAVLPEPQASLAQGILLGIRGNIPPKLRDNFTFTGTTHILAISGVNLNIVAGMLVATGIWLFGKQRRLYIWLALAAVWVYSLLTGFNPPVVRAAFIVSLFLFADLLGRQRSILTALAFAAAVMTALTPRVLWDASFQLSFLAMLGLIFIVPPLQNMGKNIVVKIAGEEGGIAAALKWITDSLAVTLGVTVIVWPLIAHYFGVFSLVSPLATLLILPAMPAIMLFTALAAILGLFFTPLGIAFGWVAWLFLYYMMAIVNGFAKLPAAALSTGNLHPFVVLEYFVLLAAVIFTIRQRKAVFSGFNRGLDAIGRVPKIMILPPLAVLIILFTIFNLTLPDDKLHVHYLDVGQGDAILIRMGSQDILIDGGPSPQALNRELGQVMPFWNRTIELVILTHPHADHLNGLIDAVKKYRVGEILQPATGSTSTLWQEWQSLIDQRDIEVTVAVTGQNINFGQDGISVEVLNAPSAGDADSLDDEGIVLRLTDGDVSFLFTADITATTELELLLDRVPLRSTVLKVAHHGSETATSTEFLQVVKPVLAVISVGAGNDYGHPTKATLSRLAYSVKPEYVYRTDLNGTIELITDGERLWLTKDR